MFVFPKFRRDVYRIWPHELAFLGKFYTKDFLLFEQLVTCSGFKNHLLRKKHTNLVKSLSQDLMLSNGVISHLVVYQSGFV